MPEMIRIRGARTHNLKNIDLDIPRNQLVVITGLSGSGKSSIAFDTLYAEGQRRYAESVSSYARRFMDVLDKPDVDAIEGLSPSIAIEQHSAACGSRSTVGTVTEINDYLRILFARAGVPYCPEHDVPLTKSGVHDMVDAVLAEPEGARIVILAPFAQEPETKIAAALRVLLAKGFMRVRIDEVMYTIDTVPQALFDDPLALHRCEVIVDRLKASDKQRTRLAESFEAALKISDGVACYLNSDTGQLARFHTHYGCPVCARTMPEMTPAMFSFNNALGACPHCEGAGSIEDFDPDLVVRDARLSLRQGAVCGCTPSQKANFAHIERAAQELGFSLDAPFESLPDAVRDYILQGRAPESNTMDFEGVLAQLRQQWKRAKSSAVKVGMSVLRSTMTCPVCAGSRHRYEVQHIYIGKPQKRVHMIALERMPLDEVLTCLKSLEFDALRAPVAAPLIDEIVKRLQFLIDVGLAYLTLARASATLSGGEMQRIRLAGQISAGLTGVTYVLDEPTIGLHPRDTDKVIEMLKRLTAAGNSVIVVEHDPDVIAAADWIIDMGPGAGVHGGQVMAQGTVAQIRRNRRSRTGRYLARTKPTALNMVELDAQTDFLVIRNATGHNLQNVTCRFPVAALSVVTGVSGSGKSTLINDTLAAHLKRRLHKAKAQALDFETIDGVEHFDKIIEVDQSPIGRTPRSNPATYTGIMPLVREVFAQTPAAKERGYGPGRFTFNTDGGCCEACQGEGQIKIEMGILPPVYVPCPTCNGRRYNRETLEVKYHGKSIADVLDMTVDEAMEFFSVHERIVRRLQTLSDVGLGYIGLGQSAITFSGGEAQRIKLAHELSRRDTGRTLYILDEPTTGLHFDDVAALMQVLQRLRDLGNTIIVIEHNLDVIAQADWVVDIGPEGGLSGGRLVCEGSVHALMDCEQSLTGQYLRNMQAKSRKRSVSKTAKDENFSEK